MAPVIPEDGSELDDDTTPSVSFADARRIMTRTDFLEPLDSFQIIAIDLNHRVRIDSTLLLRAAQRAIAEEGFDDMLDQTRERVDEIEGSSGGCLPLTARSTSTERVDCQGAFPGDIGEVWRQDDIRRNWSWW